MEEQKQKKEAEILKEWFEKQKQFKRIKEIARQIEISYSTLGHYLKGRKIQNKEHRQKLYELTGIEIFKVKDVPAKIPPEDEEIISKRAKESERLHIDMASELRNWFYGQDRWSSQKEFAGYLGIPYSSLKKMFQGRRIPKGAAKQRLYEVTQLNCFKDVELKIGPRQITKDRLKPKSRGYTVTESIERIEKCVEELQKEMEILKEGKIEKRSMATPKDEVENLVNIFYSLARALEPFKRGTNEQRERVRHKIPAQDLGYVMSFLKAMYNKDNFADFMFFSKYKLRGDKNE